MYDILASKLGGIMVVITAKLKILNAVKPVTRPARILTTGFR
jgi:hypothetical protein